MTSKLLISLLIGYLIGSIPFTQIIAKWQKGIDLRVVGSKNVGGMNTINNIGIGWGLLAGSLDVGKGILSLVAANAIGVSYPENMWAGLAAIAGHNWPLWLRFRGGKGIAVALGLCIYVAFPETLIAFLIAFTLYWLVKRNIVITAFVLFFTTAILMNLRGYPPEVPAMVWGSLLIMIIATMPGIIRTIKSPGGLSGYMKKPNEVYENNIEDESNGK